MFVDVSACVAERLVLETQNLYKVVGRRLNPRPSRIVTNSRLFSILHLVELLLSIFASVCEMKLRLCLKP